MDFVEIEQAWHYVIWNSEEQKKFNCPWWAKGWFRVRVWRSPEAGMAYLAWASNLRVDENDPTSEFTYQATSAQEIISLYHWWVDVRPMRPDPMDASGWSELCEQRRLRRKERAISAGEEEDDDLFESLDDKSPAEQAESRRVLDLSHQLEEENEKEDEAMMIRLIKIRQALWT